MSVVLVVDDQPAVRTALEILFDVHGFAVACVATPDEWARCSPPSWSPQ